MVFRNRFRIFLKLFWRLHHDLPLNEQMLSQNFDALGSPGATSWQKIFNSLRRLAVGAILEKIDEKRKMSPTSQPKALKLFFASRS